MKTKKPIVGRLVNKSMKKISEAIKGINLSEEKTIIKILVVFLMLVFVYYHIIEPILERKHCRKMAREEARENCRYGDVDCIIDHYEYFYNLCLEHK